MRNNNFILYIAIFSLSIFTFSCSKDKDSKDNPNFDESSYLVVNSKKYSTAPFSQDKKTYFLSTDNGGTAIIIFKSIPTVGSHEVNGLMNNTDVMVGYTTQKLDLNIQDILEDELDSLDIDGIDVDGIVAALQGITDPNEIQAKLQELLGDKVSDIQAIVDNLKAKLKDTLDGLDLANLPNTTYTEPITAGSQVTVGSKNGTTYIIVPSIQLKKLSGGSETVTVSANVVVK